MTLIILMPGNNIKSVEAAVSGKHARTVGISLENDYVEGKVNDPVSKRDRDAYIVCENPVFRLTSDNIEIQDFEIVVYANEYVEDHDKGVRNRIVKRSVSQDEQVQLLPDDAYERYNEEGTLYDFVNRCFVVRICQGDGERYFDEYYFGLVDADMFAEMSNEASELGINKDEDDNGIDEDGHNQSRDDVIYESPAFLQATKMDMEP